MRSHLKAEKETEQALADGIHITAPSCPQICGCAKWAAFINGKMQILQFYESELEYIPFPFHPLLISFGRIILTIVELLCTEEIAFTKQPSLSHFDKQSNGELSAAVFMCVSISVKLEGSTLDCTMFHITG